MPASLPHMQLNCSGRILDLSSPCVMGVLNVTPDSFSDGGRFTEVDVAVERALQMVEEGAAIIDIGGESTRPGAQPVDEIEELDRILPVIEKLAPATDVVISVDTMKPAVMQAACAAGARLINDVNALRAHGALEVAAETNAAICLMHMQGEPRTMQSEPKYRNVTQDIMGFLRERMDACEAAGIIVDRLILDPGFGFGKSLAHNLQLLGELDQFTALGRPLLVGVSRKSMFGALLNAPPDQRIFGGLSAAALAIWQGASIIRTHDVLATAQAVKVAAAITEYREKG